MRLLVFDETSEEVIVEYGYQVDGAATAPASTVPTPGSASVFQVTSRLEDLVAVDGTGTMVALEISTDGTVQTAHLYEFTLPADDSAPSSDRPLVLEKSAADRHSFRVARRHRVPGHGASARELDDGRRSLVLVSDNDFGVPESTATMFAAYALEVTA